MDEGGWGGVASRGNKGSGYTQRPSYTPVTHPAALPLLLLQLLLQLLVWPLVSLLVLALLQPPALPPPPHPSSPPTPPHTSPPHPPTHLEGLVAHKHVAIQGEAQLATRHEARVRTRSPRVWAG
jgi:hypothetical protein